MPADWYQRLPMNEQDELNEAAGTHQRSLRKGEVIDFVVHETWKDKDPKSGWVVYAMKHPAGIEGFRSYEEAEEACKALLHDPVRQQSTELDLAIVYRSHFVTGDGTKRGLRYYMRQVPKWELPQPARMEAIMHKLRAVIHKVGSDETQR